MEPGLVIVVNGRSHHLKGIALVDGPHHVPIWLVNVDGSKATATSLEAALLGAAREANAQPPQEG